MSIAMDQQIVPQPDTPIYTFFPGLSEDCDPRKRDITIKHLLTMSAGCSQLLATMLRHASGQTVGICIKDLINNMYIISQ